MFKDFSDWHSKKRLIHEQEIWWVAIGCNVRFEEDGKGEEYARPVLILRKFNQYLFYGVPLSTTSKRGPYYCEFTYKDGVKSAALLSQMRAFDANRLLRKDGVINDKDYQTVQERLAAIICRKAQK